MSGRPALAEALFHGRDIVRRVRDGQADIVTGEHRGKRRVTIWVNGHEGQAWLPQIVDAGKESHLGTQLADLDQDGDLDILSIGWDDYQHLHLWRNDAIQP